jgi:hypothetical protein
MDYGSKKLKSEGLHEKHAVAFAFRNRETKKNLYRGGRSQDLPDTDF